MKAYLFDTETGLYEGETFAEAATLGHESGLTPVPPPAYGHGQVPVFDRRHSTWILVPVTVARQLLGIRGVGTLETPS
mgnify:CR=1 FL=1